MKISNWSPIIWERSRGIELDGCPEGTAVACNLPIDEDRVLLSTRSGHVYIDRIIHDGKNVYLDRGGGIENITAWMHLPEPYKTDEERK